MIRLELPRSVGETFQGGRHGGRQGWRRQFPTRFDLFQPPVKLIIPARHRLELLDQRVVLLGQLRILLLDTFQPMNELLDRDRGSCRRGCVGAVAPLGRSGCLRADGGVAQGQEKEEAGRDPQPGKPGVTQSSTASMDKPGQRGHPSLSWSADRKARTSRTNRREGIGSQNRSSQDDDCM